MPLKVEAHHSEPQRGVLRLNLSHAVGLRAADSTGLSDPYVTLAVGLEPKPNRTLLQSRVCKQTLNPQWDQTFEIRGSFDELCRGPMRLNVFDEDAGGKYERLGDKTIDLRRVPLGTGRSVALTALLNDKQETHGEVHLALQWRFDPLPTDHGILHVHVVEVRAPCPQAYVPSAHSACHMRTCTPTHTPRVCVAWTRHAAHAIHAHAPATCKERSWAASGACRTRVS